MPPEGKEPSVAPHLKSKGINDLGIIMLECTPATVFLMKLQYYNLVINVTFLNPIAGAPPPQTCNLQSRSCTRTLHVHTGPLTIFSLCGFTLSNIKLGLCPPLSSNVVPDDGYEVVWTLPCPSSLAQIQMAHDDVWKYNSRFAFDVCLIYNYNTSEWHIVKNGSDGSQRD